MLRRLGTNKKSLVIIPVALALALTWLFLPVKEVSIEPYGTLSLESKIVITTGYQAAYANPAEYLLNPSFTGGTTDWTLDTTYYDPSEYPVGDSAGSIKTMTSNKKNDTQTGTCSQTISTAIGSSDTVTLSLWYKKGYTVGVLTQDLKAQIALPSDPAFTTPIDIWSETTTGNIVWTEVPAFDVSAYFTETGTYQFRFHMFLDNTNEVTEVWANIDNTHLDVIPAPDISNLPTSKAFGTVNPGTDYWSNGSAPTFPLDNSECFFAVTNDSSQAVNIAIKATDFEGGALGWTLGTSPGPNTVTLKVGKVPDEEGDLKTLTTVDQPFITGLNLATSLRWELKMETPTVFGNADEKTATITLTASF